MNMKVFLGADHRGFELKEKIKEWLASKGHEVHDLGAHRLDPADDYPDFAVAVAEKVAANFPEARGVLMCGSGLGMDVAANKVRGARACALWSVEAARHARTNDDINIASIPADWVSPDNAAEIVRAFIETPFSGEERHARRLKKIAETEEKNFK